MSSGRDLGFVAYAIWRAFTKENEAKLRLQR